MDDQMAIVARGLTKRYRALTAVNNLDLDVPRGSVYGFLGPNGAGKTTTIRMLLGLIRPTSGSAIVLGYDIEQERIKLAAKVGAIVETPAFYGYLSGAENLRVMANSSNISIDRKRIDELLERVGLQGRGHHRVKTYSLGMKQRLGIAATLLSNPDILFFDEPTNGLDPAGTVEMRHLISQLGREGHTIFLSSHLLGEVEQVCTDVMIIQQGVKRLQGNMSELLSASGGFVIKASPIDRAYLVLNRYPKLKAKRESEDSVFITAEANEIPQLIRTLVQDAVDIYQVQERRNSLEKIFLELTGQPSSQPSSNSVEVSPL